MTKRSQFSFYNWRLYQNVKLSTTNLFLWHPVLPDKFIASLFSYIVLFPFTKNFNVAHLNPVKLVGVKT